MSLRDIFTAAVLGALGIVAAVAIAAFANKITGEEIGLASEPVSVIPADSRVRPAPAPGPKDRDDDGQADVAELGDDHGGNSGPGGGDDSSGPGSGEVEREPADDNGGDNSGHGSGSSGSDSSGSGSSGSGSGSSGSDSSGSGSSGSGGSDDPPEVESD